MIKGVNLVLFFTSIFALVGVYTIKYQSEAISSDKHALMRTIDQQQARLSSLRADWAYLNQPANIAPLVARYSEVLKLETVSAEQFGTIADLPMRPEITNDAALTALFAALDAGIDPIGDKLAELLEQ